MVPDQLIKIAAEVTKLLEQAWRDGYQAHRSDVARRHNADGEWATPTPNPYLQDDSGTREKV